MTAYHVGILGSGSVALCLAGHFHAAGAQVTMFVRAASVPKLRGKAITVSGVLGEHTVPADQMNVEDAARPKTCDMLIVTTKAFDVETALRPFAELDRTPAVLLMQNGLGSVDMARAALGDVAHIYSATMMIGMARTAPTEATVLGCAGPIGCGALTGGDSGPLEHMLEIAQNGFIPFKHDLLIRETVLFKLLFNTSMNPTGALTGQTYGALLDNPHTRALIIGLAEETLAVLSAAYGYRPVESGRAYVDGPLSKIVYPNAVKHESSMLQDMKAGRRTEIDVLNGAVLRLAEENGLSAPRHQTIIDLVKAQELIRSGTK